MINRLMKIFDSSKSFFTSNSVSPESKTLRLYSITRVPVSIKKKEKFYQWATAVVHTAFDLSKLLH